MLLLPSCPPVHVFPLIFIIFVPIRFWFRFGLQCLLFSLICFSQIFASYFRVSIFLFLLFLVSFPSSGFAHHGPSVPLYIFLYRVSQMFLFPSFFHSPLWLGFRTFPLSPIFFLSSSHFFLNNILRLLILSLLTSASLPVTNPSPSGLRVFSFSWSHLNCYIF